MNPDGAVQKTLGIGVGWIVEQGHHVRFLHHLAGIHDHDPVGSLRNNAQIVGDEHDGGVILPLEPLHQAQNLGLNGDVQSRGGFVGNQQGRVAGQGNGDHHPLAHAAGEECGIVL